MVEPACPTGRRNAPDTKRCAGSMAAAPRSAAVALHGC
ncbi:hypothetical protein BURPS406E_D0735 [Burkholderia pseudomallei 406e]|nr:hypothetical protein BPC006_II2224 [Burkholderia pseudomallei BPC006]EDO88326.1 hypothetical protein BURPS406E_D0735 [Burkholderia pseudomallei 406e]EDO89636.1 hypothetical protein BURPSPAST_AC0667 [Burkholderia pseudomallei Pasteur 52237]EDS83327.1 hypothetical protein BURPSS13_X0403 [Burkholderia pseudomallei S13]EDU12616.1 hypothetical protein BURPS1655_D1531 [Burkholderia pseudomallei 1655]EEC34539.1 hypothetical protein BUC_6506 [Burkholderia pseudomallei 576]